jgi:hypothetical protein
MSNQRIPPEVMDSDGEQYVWRANKAIPASLLSRLSEAADGTRNNEPVYFVAQLVADPDHGHDVMGYFKKVKDAFEYPPAKPLLQNGTYMIFGPYQTKEDPESNPKDVVKVVIHRSGGKVVELDGKKFDCVFWSLSAFDKFVIPYYTSVGDLKKAAKVRKDFMKETSIAGIHIPGSDIVNEAPAGEVGTEIGTTDGLTLKQLHARVGLYQMVEKNYGETDPRFIPL